MKTTTLLLLMVLTPLAGFSQSVFDKYEEEPEVFSMTVNSPMMNLLVKLGMDLNDTNDLAFINLISKVDSLKVCATNDKNISEEMLQSTNQYVKTSRLYELKVDDATSQNQNIRYFVDKVAEGKYVNELVMSVSGSKKIRLPVNDNRYKTLLLSLMGDQMDLSELDKLTRKMNLPKELGKVKHGLKY
ncbi:DUF4252 domain-containing protein [Spongiimicrobium sp. 3-5]|uniref:DUF4252 domain-containing protein n=1 Tax=Spongiimicrobium sp. 3-5 TaxID=3332596 RepID=UPI00397FDF3A